MKTQPEKSPENALEHPEADNVSKNEPNSFCRAVLPFCNAIVNGDGDSEIAKQSRKGRKAPSMAGAPCACRAVLTFCNAIEVDRQSQPSGKYLIAPFGDYPHGGNVQRVDAVAAANMKRELSGVWTRVKNVFGNACPVFYSHPDDEHYPDAADHTPYGKVLSLETLADGIWANIKWLDGFEHLPKRLHFSPRWVVEKIGANIYRPRKLESVGLTNTPNIVGTSFANEISTQPKEKSMNKELLSLLGFAEGDAPTEEAVLEKVRTLLASQNEAAAGLEKEKSRADAAETALANEKQRADSAEEKFKAERQARAGLIVANAVSQGKIAEALRETSMEILANAADFDAAAAKLEAAQPAIKTSPATDGIEKDEKARAQSQSEADRKFKEIVAAKEASSGVEYQAAWNAAREENPDLYKTAYPAA